MARPSKTIEEIELAGNSRRLSRAQLTARRESESAPLTGSQRAELHRIDELIAETLAACSRGQNIRSVRGARKSAFQNLPER